MAQNKTVPTGQTVENFLDSIEDEHKRKDSYSLVDIFREVTGLEPEMWGSSMVGFGTHHYKYESGREGDIFLTGFSPRKQALTLYYIGDLESYGGLAQNLGKYTTGKGCLYIKKLSDVDSTTLKALLTAVYERKTKPES